MTALSESVDLARHGRIAVLTIDNPPANALSHHVRKGLKDGIGAAAADPAVGAIVITAAGLAFIGGGDQAEFGKPARAPGVHEILDLIEGAPKPVIAALHGTSIHIDLEVALACHHRVAARAARFGVFAGRLGLLPGAGGTQRLPRLVGVEKALQMIVGGETIGAENALRHGLLDEIVEGALTPAAVAFAEKAVSERRPLRRTRDLDDKRAAARGKPEMFAAFRTSGWNSSGSRGARRWPSVRRPTSRARRRWGAPRSASSSARSRRTSSPPRSCWPRCGWAT